MIPKKDHGGLLLPGDPEFHRKPAGHCIIDGNEVAVTLMCVHCNMHWIPIKGSGRKRGYCFKCSGVTCGKPGCVECLPFEKRMDLYEKGKLGVLL